MAGTREKDKVESALSGVRSLVLGVQILLGFQYRAAFEPRFRALPPTMQDLAIAATVLLVVSMACMIAPSSYHRIAESGHAKVRMHSYTKAMATGALAPFALALGLNVVVALIDQLGLRWAGALGAVVALASALCWFGPALARHGDPPQEKDEMTQTKDRITELLTESRIILPGVQALLGFQFASYLMQSFEKLPPSAKAVNTASLFLLVVSMILLMTPAPYHRLAEHGENTESFERAAEKLILASLLPLALGVAGDVYVVVAAILGSVGIAAAVAAACGVGMVALWFGLPLAARLGLGYAARREGP